MKLVLLTLAAAASTCFAADLFPVAGTILNAGTNSPLPHAYVFFYPSAGAKLAASSVTGEDGRFRFELPAGSYRLLAGTRDVQESYGTHATGSAFGSAVIVGPGQDTSRLAFRFFVPGAITGRIVDESGEPVEQALVQLVRSTIVAGKRTAAVLAYERTDDRGQYRFGHLPGGVQYYLAVTGNPWYSRGNLEDAPGAQAAAAYAPVYYPDTNDPSRATPISLASGQEARADFRLTAVPNATITVKYSAPAGLQGTIGLTSDGVAGTSAFQVSQQLSVPAFAVQPDAARQGPQLTATLQSIPPGHYTLRMLGAVSGNAFGATVPVDVNGSNATVNLDLRPFSKIEGTVHLPPAAVTKTPLVASVRGSVSGAVGTVAVRADGTFSFPNVEPGRYRVAVAGTGFFTSGLEVRDGGTLKDGLVEVPELTTVRVSVTVSDLVGRVKGIVDDGQGPVAGALVVISSVPGQTVRPGGEEIHQGYQTESDGSFVFSEPAGRYLLFAVDNSDLEYMEPKALVPYLSRSGEVEIQAGATAEKKIPLLPPATN